MQETVVIDDDYNYGYFLGQKINDYISGHPEERVVCMTPLMTCPADCGRRSQTSKMLLIVEPK